jgi:hypothetical protein
MIDSHRDANGNIVLEDTPRMWADWKAEVDRAVAEELSGQDPGGGIDSWITQWQRVIAANSNRENTEKYIAYIIDSRREAGLPELDLQ